MKPKGKREKLPKWAQNEFEVLERRLQEARARINELLSTEPTLVQLDPHGVDINEDAHFLPDNTRVRFIPDGDHANSYRKFIDVYLEGNEVVVHAGHQMLVLPHVTNKLSVKLEPR